MKGFNNTDKSGIITANGEGSHEKSVARKTNPKNSKTSVDETLAMVLKDFKRSWDYCASNYHQRWLDSWKLYNNTRTKVAYKGITNTFVPMTFSTVETMVSALFGGKPTFNYIPPSDRQDQNTEILNSLLDFYWDKDKWNIKVINWGRSMLTYGTGIIYLYWNIDHPCITNVPLRDFFIDPTATTMENARYMGRRYLTTLSELKSFEVVDPETGEMTPKYKNLDKISPGNGPSSDNTDKEEKDMFYGSVLPEDDDQVECIEWWSKDRVVTVANRSVVIEDTENYYKSRARELGNEYSEGLMPFASQRDFIDESLFYGKGEVEVIADQQELLNDLTNQNTDSIIYTLNQMYTLSPKFAHLLNEIENLPGAVYLAEKGALSPIEQRPVPTEAFTERLNIKNEIRETTASNEIVKGVSDEKNATATEISAQIAGAGQRLGLKITQIENEGFHRLARIVFEMIKLYVTEPMMVRIVGKDGVRWEEFNPDDYQTEYEPRVQLQATIENNKAEDANQAKEMMAAFLNDPDVNQAELKKLVLAKGFKLDPDEVEVLMTPPEMPLEDTMLPEEMMETGIDEAPPEPTLVEEEPMTEVEASPTPTLNEEVIV